MCRRSPLTTLFVALFTLCGCRASAQSTTQPSPKLVRTATQGTEGTQWLALGSTEWLALWERAKAQVSSSDPPSRLRVHLALSVTDEVAEAMLNSLLKRELRSLQYVEIVSQSPEAHWVVFAQARILRVPDAEPIYFLSLVLAERYSNSDAQLEAIMTAPVLYDNDLQMAERFLDVRDRVMEHFARWHQRILQPVSHDTAVVVGSDLKGWIEASIARYDSAFFEQSLKSLRARTRLADGFKRGAELADELLHELEKRGRKEPSQSP
jgi:hypothetical protein